MVQTINENNYDEYYKFDKDDVFFGRNVIGKDIFKDRPHIHTEANMDLVERTIKDEILKKEQNIVNKGKKANRSETIMDVKLGDILTNLSNVITNFWSDYKNKLVSVKLEMDELTLDDKDKNILYLLKVHSVSFVRYLQDDDNCIYMGIFFILISILLYFINIIR